MINKWILIFIYFFTNNINISTKQVRFNDNINVNIESKIFSFNEKKINYSISLEKNILDFIKEKKINNNILFKIYLKKQSYLNFHTKMINVCNNNCNLLYQNQELVKIINNINNFENFFIRMVKIFELFFCQLPLEKDIINFKKEISPINLKYYQEINGENKIKVSLKNNYYQDLLVIININVIELDNLFSKQLDIKLNLDDDKKYNGLLEDIVYHLSFKYLLSRQIFQENEKRYGLLEILIKDLIDCFLEKNI
jgi:hypothetical protein